MPRELNRLTERELNVRPEPGATSLKMYSDGGGLYLQVMPQGAKSFVFRYTFSGKAQLLGLGPTHAVSLEDAREAARGYRAMLLKGMDPKAERERQRADEERRRAAEAAVASRTFKWCAEQYVETHKHNWANDKHVEQWRSTLEAYAYPKIGGMQVGDVGVDEVLMVLQPIWHTKTETASRLRGRIERILGWATILGYRTEANPARWKAYLSEVLAAPRKIAQVEHQPAIPHREIAAFLACVRNQPDSMAVCALEFLTLTAARTGEVIGATWSEFDFEEKVWTVPAERMKARRIHEVPLSGRALEILQGIPRFKNEPYVFRGMRLGKPLSNMAMLQLAHSTDRGHSFQTMAGSSPR